MLRCATVGLAAVAAGEAHAAECSPNARFGSCIDADTLWPMPGAGRLQSVAATETIAPGRLSFGLVTSYAHKPILLRVASPDPDGTEIPVVEHLVDSTFLWATGITERLELLAALPATFYQSGAGVSGLGQSRTTPLARTAVRDLRFGLGYAWVPRPRRFPGSMFGLTTRLLVVAPVGAEDAFAGDRAAVWAPSVAADLRAGRWFGALELGARLRSTTGLANARVGSQALVALGAGFDILAPEKLSAAIEAFALPTFVAQKDWQTAPAPAGPVSERADRILAPAEWMATVRAVPTRDGDVSIALSGGTALPLPADSSLTAPLVRVVLGVRYAPLGRDTDGDGVLDTDDACPSEKEDRDGFSDEDGCRDADNDRDGLADEQDRCRDSAEDHDGVRDEDGCPDLDDDRDGVPDANDKCRFKAEDVDGFEDTDGCPDPDNDADGIEDAKDLCPNAPEDRDGYNDADGCPDPDNDLDGISDDKDKCPNTREDADGFEDGDGCPESDNDQDGIPDAQDRCPLESETIDGVDDTDGCPEPGAKDLTIVRGNAVGLVTPVRFGPNQAGVSPALRRDLRMIAQRARGLGPIDRIIIETYPDTPGDSDRNVQLAERRADAVRAVFIDAGVPAALVTAAAGDLAQPRAPGAPHVQVTVMRAKQP